MTEQHSRDTGSRAADNLISIFERQILDGALKDGEPLPPEREIVQTYGVSRTVVREAVLALSNRGLVEARPRFRPIVRTPGYDAAIQAVSSIVGRLLGSENGVRSLFDLRVMMEAALAREAALNANKDHIQRLKAALEANAAAIHDNREFFETDIAFHAVLYEIPNNPALPSIHKAYADWLSPQWVRMTRHVERNTKNHQAHTRIFDMILLRDPDEAERALRDHLDDAWQQVRATFTEL